MNFDTDVAVMSGHTLKKAGYEIPFANSVAIVSNGNTHTSISSGEYVYVYNHNTLNEGLYVATASIAQNGNLSSSNLSSITRGLGGQVTVLNGKVGNLYNTIRGATNATTGKFTFTAPLGSAGLVTMGANAPVTFGNPSSGFYTSTMPANWTASASGTSITLTRSNPTSQYSICVIILNY